MALLTKRGYGQVEPNHLSGQRTGQIYAQLPAAASMEVVENGMFLIYDMANNEINSTGDGEPMLVYSEVKLYDKAHQGYKDFALLKNEAVEGKIYPRLIKTNVGDIFTTNLVDLAAAKGSRVGVKLTIVGGLLTETSDVAEAKMVFKVVKETTMPDGQEAVKIQRIA